MLQLVKKVRHGQCGTAAIVADFNNEVWSHCENDFLIYPEVGWALQGGNAEISGIFHHTALDDGQDIPELHVEIFLHCRLHRQSLPFVV
jgi:hypothetical protein